MANVMSEAGRDRAQLILVSGLTIAVTLLVLILLLNTTIYTENVATRGTNADIGDVAKFQQVLDDEIQRIVDSERGENQEAVNDSVSSAIDYLLVHLMNSSIERGQIVDYHGLEMTPGGWISNESVADNTTIVENVNRTHIFNITIEDTNWDTTEFIVIQTGAGSFSINGTGSGIALQNDDNDVLCEEDNSSDSVTFSIIEGTAHADNGSSECIGHLWNDITKSGESEIVEISRSSSNVPVIGVEFVAGGNDISVNAPHDVEWYVDEVGIEVGYTTSDLSYNSTRTIRWEDDE